MQSCLHEVITVLGILTMQLPWRYMYIQYTCTCMHVVSFGIWDAGQSLQPWPQPWVGVISILNHFWADLRFWCLPCTPPLVAGNCLLYVDVNAITLNCFNGLSVPLTTQLCAQITPKLLCDVTHILSHIQLALVPVLNLPLSGAVLLCSSALGC